MASRTAFLSSHSSEGYIEKSTVTTVCLGPGRGWTQVGGSEQSLEDDKSWPRAFHWEREAVAQGP